MKQIAIAWLKSRYAEQLRRFPRMAEISEHSYVRANLAATLRNMRTFPPGSNVYVAEAWRHANIQQTAA